MNVGTSYHVSSQVPKSSHTQECLVKDIQKVYMYMYIHGQLGANYVHVCMFVCMYICLLSIAQ